MSLLSDLYIPILPSPDFRRLVWVLTSITVGTLWYAQLPMILSLGLVLTLPWALFTGSRPYPDLETVHFSQKKWQLTFSTKKEIYQKIDIAADTGLFLLCRFSKEKEKKKRWLVIFCDQLSQDQRRALHIIEQIKGV